ncbi:response regulator [Spirosoma panaciterrae]|uniref:response regulator n=1 Tax=Spirosoma panaciterrae TaxID=496058 RepID=UPI000A07A6DD|nr:response regulator [Spirosoma panaciterrae]
MSSCLLVESDPIIANQLTAFLAQTTLFDPPIVCSTAMEAFQLLTDCSVDLILLDLDLPDLTGIKSLEGLVNAPPVIVLAGAAEQAAACYDLDMVVDFLLKPVPYSRFLLAIQRTLLPQFNHNFTRDTNLIVDKKEFNLVKPQQIKRFVPGGTRYSEG